MAGKLSGIRISGVRGLVQQGQPFDVAVTVRNTGDAEHTFRVHAWITEAVTGSGCGLGFGTSVADLGSRDIYLGVGGESTTTWGGVDAVLRPGTWYAVAKVYTEAEEAVCVGGAYQSFTVTAPTVSAEITGIAVS